ncbi:hypothetical protein [Clostridium akagii]|uniref:hypothetical protein n=1 Tax=Clostridium akagii TaxID=91623 RepID=UPI00047D70BB|nr:hypothetical protein [Clostridium akagii]
MKKTILGAALVAVMATSVTSYSATNVHQTSDSNKGTQISLAGSKQQVQNSAAAKVSGETTQGVIEYSKRTEISKDGSKSIEETWVNPNTFDFRDDINNVWVNDSQFKETDAQIAKTKQAKANIVKYSSTYNEGKHVVNITRDDNGNAVKGNEYQITQKEADSEIQDIQKNRSFAGIKALYADSSVWKDAGTYTTSDGKKLKKVSSGDINDEMHVIYLNEDGLPVKVDVYLKGKLTNGGSTTEYEYKLIQDDGKIFNTSGVKLVNLGIL